MAFAITATAALIIDLRSGASKSVATASAASLPPAPGAVPASITASAITVVGSGSATAVPDQAQLNLAVTASRVSVREALAATGVEMTTLLNALHNQGVQDKDIQTSAISVSQEGPCCPRSITGYAASTQVTVLVHHLNNVGAVITAAAEAVGNDLGINGVGLFASDTSAQVSTARSAAMADATARAKQWVALAGRHLGRILAISEAVTSAVQPVFFGAGGFGGGGGGIPINPGQTSLGLTITVVYELVD
jgi:uncharacterized protein YggE